MFSILKTPKEGDIRVQERSMEKKLGSFIPHGFQELEVNEMINPIYEHLYAPG